MPVKARVLRCCNRSGDVVSLCLLCCVKSTPKKKTSTRRRSKFWPTNWRRWDSRFCRFHYLTMCRAFYGGETSKQSSKYKLALMWSFKKIPDTHKETASSLGQIRPRHPTVISLSVSDLPLVGTSFSKQSLKRINSFIESSLLCLCLGQAETRAEFAERSVAKLEKSIDDLEGTRSAPLARRSFCWSTPNRLCSGVSRWPTLILIQFRMCSGVLFSYVSIIVFSKPLSWVNGAVLWDRQSRF